MALFDLSVPNFVGWFETAKNAGLERDEAKMLITVMMNSYITGLWTSGKRSKVAKYLGLGSTEQDVATAVYVSLQPAVEKNLLLKLTVPQEMLEDDNISRFQSEEK